LDQARLAYQQALTANPDNCDALNQLGVMARREGRFEDAEALYLRCLTAQPMYAQARLNLAILYELYLGRLGEALTAYHAYEQTLDEPDTRVRGWVMDLERRVAAIAKR
jgi:lipoprotein NlpI